MVYHSSLPQGWPNFGRQQAAIWRDMLLAKALVHFLALGLTCEPKFTNLGWGPAPAAGAFLRSCKISAQSRKRSTRCALPKFFTFLTLGPKFTKGEKTCYPSRSNILPNFIAQSFFWIYPTPAISFTKNSADKVTNIR